MTRYPTNLIKSRLNVGISSKNAFDYYFFDMRNKHNYWLTQLCYKKDNIIFDKNNLLEYVGVIDLTTGKYGLKSP